MPDPIDILRAHNDHIRAAWAYAHKLAWERGGEGNNGYFTQHGNALMAELEAIAVGEPVAAFMGVVDARLKPATEPVHDDVPDA